MKKIKKIFFWLTGIIVFTFLVVNYLIPSLINSESLKWKMEMIASKKIGSEIHFQRFDLAFFPRPHAIIRNGTVSREAVKGTIETLRIYPKILPLFKGEFRIASLHVKSPDIKIDLSERSKKAETREPLSSEAFTEKLTALLAHAPDLVVVLEEGGIDLLREERTALLFDDIYLRIIFPPLGPMFNISGRSSLREKPFNITGELLMDKKSETFRLSIAGREMDVTSVRDTAYAIAGDIPLINQIFSIVKGGDVPLIIFHSQGSSFEDLGKMKNIVIKGGMKNGEIFIPGARLDLEEVNGDVLISKGILEGSNLDAQLEDSYGQDGSLKIGLMGKDPPFHLDIKVNADLARLHSLLKRLVENKSFVDELSLIDDLKGRATGRMVLGESLKSIKADVDASNVNLTADYKRIPYKLKMTAGDFHYDQQAISVEGLKAEAGKSSLSEINFRINFREKPFLEIFSGKASIFMDETYPWFSNLVNLPSESIIRSPLSLSQIHMVWDRGVETLLKGSLTIQNGPDLSFDINRTPEKLEIHNLTVNDEESDAELSINLESKEIGFSFAGNLTGATVDNILAENKIVNGWLKGDFEARAIKDRLALSEALGWIKGEDIVVPLKHGGPLKVKSFSLNTGKRNIRIASADISIGGTHIELKGDINVSENEFLFDIDAAAGGLEYEDLKNIFAGEKKNKDNKLFYEFPLKGTIRLNSGSFTYGEYKWKPFHSDIMVSADSVKVAVKKAAICGISFPGSIGLTPQKISLKFMPNADYKDLKSVIACLLNTDGHVTGIYDLDGNVEGSGKGGEIIESLSGGFKFNAGDGRIYRGGILAKIFAFLNLTEIFRGRMPDLVEEGFAYKTITAKGELKGSLLSLKEMVIDGSSMQIFSQGTVNIREKKVDFEVLLAPLKTVDFIIEKIPVLREITGGTLLSIPVKVKGDISDPEITYLSPAAIGSGLLGVMKNTIQVPYKIIEPILPREDEKDAQ